MKLAPIVLFVYNRPWHTRQTLEALKLNDLSQKSHLYIFSDGPKKDADLNDRKKIQEVRSLLREEDWCGSVTIIEREENLGLAQSVINGVSEVISKHGKVIVLEDDLIIGKYFLNFLNDGLNVYEDQQQVFGISGYKFYADYEIENSTFFLPIMSSWGYGTWLDKWQKINFDTNELLQAITTNKLGNKLDFGNFPFFKMLQDQAEGNIDSWAIRFYVSMYLQEGLFLFPNKSLLRNAGFDGTGVHSGISRPLHYDPSKDYNDKISVHPQTVKLNEKLVKDMERISSQSNSINGKGGLKGAIKRIIPSEFIQFARRKLANSPAKQKEDESFPRYTKTKKKILGKWMDIPDIASFHFMYKEIFLNEIYKFYTGKRNPYIIDGGANIGLSIMYFKQYYPHSVIMAFEPDPEIFKILQGNINQFSYENVELINKGLWDGEENLEFLSEGADGGVLSDLIDRALPSTIVRTTSLNNYLNQDVDFLKLDIEGAETIVLKNIQPNLEKVKRIFIEYHSFKGKPQSIDQILNILIAAGFRLHINSPGVSSNSPFVNLNVYNNMDMQLNIFGYKE